MVAGGGPAGAHATAAIARDFVGGWALSQVGKSDPVPYWEACGVKPPYPKYWCGAFALTALIRARLCEWKWKIGDGFLFRLRRTSCPLCGDIAYFEKKEHHAVFIGDDQFVNGNGRNGEVTLSVGNHPTAYYSIAQLVDKFDAEELEAINAAHQKPV